MTDVENYNGTWTKAPSDPDSYPAGMPGLTIGHEASGEIVEIGEGANMWKVGDRIALEPSLYCQQCPNCVGLQYKFCTAWEPHQSMGINSRSDDGAPEYHGAMAEYFAVPVVGKPGSKVAKLFRIHPGVSDLGGAAVETLAMQIALLRDARVQLADDIVIFGASDENIMMAQLARLIGARVVVIDPYEHRRDVVHRVGIDHVIDPNTVDPVSYVLRLMPFGADYTLTGPETFNMAIDLTRERGTITRTEGSWTRRSPDPDWLARQGPLASPDQKHIAVPDKRPWHREETSWGGTPRHNYDIAMQLLASEKLDVESYVRTIRYADIEQLPRSFERFYERDIKVGLTV
jgi:threonine dehydrogenase-like Zn-dependent dehydrogenase